MNRAIVHTVFGMAFLVSSLAAISAPVVDLNGSTAGRNYTAYHAEGQTYVDIASGNVSITDGLSTNPTKIEISLLNKPDGASESLGFHSYFGSLTEDYNAATGLLTITGAGTLGQYTDALGSVVYTNTEENLDLQPRYVTVRVSNATEESNLAVVTVKMFHIPENPSLTILMEDTFDGASLDTSKWAQTSGNAPTLSGGKLTLQGGEITVNPGFRGAPLYFLAENLNMIAIPTDSAVDVGVVSPTTGSLSRSIWWGYGESSGGYFFSYTFGAFSNATQGGFFTSDDPLLIDEDAQFLLMDTAVGYFHTGYANYATFVGGGQAANYGLRLRASGTASLSTDRVVVATINSNNPAYKVVANGDSSTTTFGTTGVEMSFTHSSSNQVALSASRIDSDPPGFPTVSLPFFYDVSGTPLPGSYTVNLKFNINFTAYTGSGLDFNNLFLYYSEDMGVTWTAVAPTEVNVAGGYITLNGINHLSLWTVGPAPGTTDSTSWQLYR